MSEFLDLARDLSELGYFTFPCREAGKEPLCPHGVDAAARDERTILHWADKWPQANSAIALGPSDVLGVDIDAKHGASPGDVIGELDLDPAAIVRIDTGIAPEPDDENPSSLAGERGAHIYFRGAVDSVTKTRIPGVEIRSRGLYLMAPGSRHPSGVLYEGRLPHVRLLPRPPDSVLELHAHGAATYGTGDLIVPDDDDEPIEQGGRRKTLLGWAIENLYKRGIVGEAALTAMLAENHRRVSPPLPPAEVKRLWRWADKSRIARVERQVAALRAESGEGALWAGHGLRRTR